MKIIITNTVVLNGGDSAILYALIDVLKKTFGTDTEFVVYDNQPVVAHRYYPELELRKLIYLNITDVSNGFLRRCVRGLKFARLLWRYPNTWRFYFAAYSWAHGFKIFARLLLKKDEAKDLEVYDSADIIISTGGTYLVENYDLSSRIFDYKISLLLGKPLVFFTQSLGPFSNRRNRTALSKIFNNALLILLRDEGSYKHLMDLDVDMSKVHVFPDIAFALPKEEIPQRDSNRTYYPKRFLNVGISVRDWKFFKTIDSMTGMQRYMDAVSKIITHLKGKYNARITFISTCQGIPEYWADDSKVALKICNGLADNVKKSVRVDNNFHTPFELLEILESFDLVIATRMHMAILSLLAGTPVIPIAYEFKTKELCARLGLTEWAQDIEMLDGETCQQSIDFLVAHFTEISKTVFENVEKERHLAIDSGKKVKEAYNRWSKMQSC